MCQASILLSVIIISYNTRELTLKCLDTLYERLDGLEAEVWVVDNASQDGSVAAVRERFPQVNVIESDRNLGFGAANNRAMECAKGRFFLLLNSDAFPEGNAIQTLLAFAEKHPRAGAIGALLLNADGSFQELGRQYFSPWQVFKNYFGINRLIDHFSKDFGKPAPTGVHTSLFFSGACLLVRREVFEQVGGFDEAFFFYGEEVDWQQRMLKAGWEVGCDADASVIHLHGSSGGRNRLKLTLSAYDGIDIYMMKHWGFLGALSVRIFTFTGHLIRVVFRDSRHLFHLKKPEAFGLIVGYQMMMKQLDIKQFFQRYQRVRRQRGQPQSGYKMVL